MLKNNSDGFKICQSR